MDSVQDLVAAEAKYIINTAIYSYFLLVPDMEKLTNEVDQKIRIRKKLSADEKNLCQEMMNVSSCYMAFLGFSTNMGEVHRNEQSVLYQKNSGSHSAAQSTQFCFDNANININTLYGNNIFHCMGGIRCTTPASAIKISSIPRISETPKASEITVPISSGLKYIEIKQLSLVPVNSVARALVRDLLWISGRWAGISAPPS
ncbi:hypothetical protein PR048_004396 [Dryococelus australis]|uniref:Uncharacterized protein n=1 Tax=Dryococelus australis TaxID=614101 RepID=A0ABQ9I5B2_9NEOP|nr:hypothetical protein PR048_004396 [Dryococelus australis]